MANQIKIGFIQATSKSDVDWFKPLFYGYLKSYVEKYCDVPLQMIYMENLNVREDFDIVGVSSTSQSFSIATDMGRKIKEFNKDIITIIGGHHITYMPETLPEEFDIGVLGEGEETFLELIQYFHKNGLAIRPEILGNIKGLVFHDGEGVFITPKRELINPLDRIPFPDRSNANAPYFFTSRGCPYKCSFCSSSAFWDKTRFFSAEYVIEEIESVLERAPNLCNIAIWDDLFIVNKPRFKKFIKLVRKSKYHNKISINFAVRANLVNDELCEDLKSINASGAGFGAESGSDRILKVLQKGTTVEMNQKAIDTFHKHKIPLVCSFIVGIPSETEDEVRNTYEFILRNVFEGKLEPRCPVNVLMPMPGTEIWKQAIKSGLIDLNNMDWERLAIFSSYRDSSFKNIDEWVMARRRNNSIYLAEDTLPKSRLYELMYVYENAIKTIEEKNALKQYAVNLNQIIMESKQQIAKLTLELKQQRKDAQAKIVQITSSNSWRINLPLCEMRRWISTLKQQAQRYVRGGLRFAKRTYQSLPLSYQTKAAHRKALAKYFPKLLLASGTHPTTIPVLTLPAMKQAMSEQFTSLADFAKSIEIPASQNPLVSVIIPIYGKIDYTLRCLASIAANPPQATFEVIVVDDCSPDNSAEILININGIRLIRNEQNQGFIRSCNAGASAAQGKYLYFLNNDTEVTFEWMDELLRTFQEFPGTGLAGSKLVYPDGRLQEAGGIIWQDGSASNFGRFADPLLPVYNYAREVDYCSGASIMVPKVLFEELGKFDEHYLPAYCEDTDLALKIRDKGYRVIYQPLSTIIHYEGVTSGTDTSQGTKAYQIENSKKLSERWKSRLQTHQPTGMDIDNAKDRRAKRRVLVIEHCTPTPNQDAGSVTVLNLMLLLREMDFQVTFIPEDNFLYMSGYTTALQRVGIEVLYSPYATSVEKYLKGCGARYDLALLFRPGVVERHLKTIRKHCPKAKVLYHTVDLHFLRISREAALQSDKAKQKAAVEMKQREYAAIRTSDASIIHSTAELELLRSELPDAKIHVFPLIMDVQGTSKTFSERRDIVFVGGYQHAPNVDAVQYFVAEIMPLLRKHLPSVRFYAVGSRAPSEIQALASEDVIITGFVEDLKPLLDKMRVSVAPLRYGAGIKGKIGTAMAVGLPVVVTPLAAEGMSLTDGENILVAKGAEQFADAVARLYQDEALWNRISHNSLEFAENAWSAESAWKILNEILTDISISTIRNVYPLSLFSGLNMPQKEINKQPNALTPIASVKSRENYILALDNNSLKQIRWVEKTLTDANNSEAFAVDGFCVPCNKKVSFMVDMQYGSQRQDNGWLPNWRERLECPLCRMNNRQRLIATLVKQELDLQFKKHVYFMEQVTPIYNWAIDTFKNHNIVGSEYLGHEYEGGAIIKGIRHEDVENLSFPDDALDLIVSNDVFEHVPNPARAFAECSRVLKVGGGMFATFPFHSNNDESIIRAKIVNGQVDHIMSPSYHGNPVSANGSLVFTDFGWDVLKEMKAADFSDVSVEVYASAEFSHLGGGQVVFVARK